MEEGPGSGRGAVAGGDRHCGGRGQMQGGTSGMEPGGSRAALWERARTRLSRQWGQVAGGASGGGDTGHGTRLLHLLHLHHFKIWVVWGILSIYTESCCYLNTIKLRFALLALSPCQSSVTYICGSDKDI